MLIAIVMRVKSAIALVKIMSAYGKYCRIWSYPTVAVWEVYIPLEIT